MEVVKVFEAMVERAVVKLISQDALVARCVERIGDVVVPRVVEQVVAGVGPAVLQRAVEGIASAVPVTQVLDEVVGVVAPSVSLPALQERAVDQLVAQLSPQVVAEDAAAALAKAIPLERVEARTAELIASLVSVPQVVEQVVATAFPSERVQQQVVGQLVDMVQPEALRKDGVEHLVEAASALQVAEELVEELRDRSVDRIAGAVLGDALIEEAVRAISDAIDMNDLVSRVVDYCGGIDLAQLTSQIIDRSGRALMKILMRPPDIRQQYLDQIVEAMPKAEVLEAAVERCVQVILRREHWPGMVEEVVKRTTAEFVARRSRVLAAES